MTIVAAQMDQQVAQAAIGREGLEHGRRVAAEGGIEQPGAIGFGKLSGIGAGGDAQQGVAPLAAGELRDIVLDLVE